MEEKVLVIESKFVNYISDKKFTRYNNIVVDGISYLHSIVNVSEFHSRKSAEIDTNYKQIIPYALFSCDDEFFMVKRTKKQTEKRLHDMQSIGIGGHINPIDSDLCLPKNKHHNPIINALHREINEELNIQKQDILDYKFIGLISDNSNNVGIVHMGVVFHFEIKYKESIMVKEIDKMIGQWINQDKLANFYPFMETWSQILTEKYINDN